MNDELHRCVVVVQDQDAIKARPLRARLGLGNDGRARPGPLGADVVLGHAGRKERAASGGLSGLSGRGVGRLLRHGFAVNDPRPAAARTRPRWHDLQYGLGAAAPQADRKTLALSERWRNSRYWSRLS